MNNLIRKLGISGIALITLSACVSTPPSLTLDSHETLRVDPPVLEKLDLQLEGQAEATAKGLALGAVGATGGAAVGATGGLILGLACGPLFIVCSPLAAVAGAGTVGFMGGAVGVGYGGKGWTSGDKGKRFNTYSETRFDLETLQDKLAREINDAARDRWQLDPASNNQLTVRVTSLRFEQLPNQYIRIATQAEMTTTLTGVAKTMPIRIEGQEIHIDQWLDDDGQLIEQEIGAALTNLTQHVFNSLTVTTSDPALTDPALAVR